MTMFSIVREGGNADLHVVNGQIQMVDGAEAIRQHLETRLALWRGEAFYNIDEGVDYADLVFPAEDRMTVAGELRRVALGTPGVLTATIEILSESPDVIVVRGAYTASVEARDEIIREEFGPIEIPGGG